MAVQGVEERHSVSTSSVEPVKVASWGGMEPAACAEEYCWNTTRLTAKRASVTVCVCVCGESHGGRTNGQAWLPGASRHVEGMGTLPSGTGKGMPPAGGRGGAAAFSGCFTWRPRHRCRQLVGSSTQQSTPQVSSPATSHVVAPVLTIEVQAVVSGALRYLVSCQKPSQVTAAAGPGVASSWLGNPRWRTRLAASHSTSVESPAACWLPPLG